MKTLRILHLEDNALDAFFVRRALEQDGLDADIVHVGRAETYQEEINRGSIDLILCDNGLPGLPGDAALEIARQRHPEVPFIFLTGATDEGQVTSRLKNGATDVILKGQSWQLINAVRRAISSPATPATASGDQESAQRCAALEQRLKERTLQLETASREFEAFSHSVSHDLRAPLRSISGFIQLLAEEYKGQFDEQASFYFNRVRSETERMAGMIDNLMRLAKFARVELKRAPVDLSAVAEEEIARLRAAEPERKVEVKIEPGFKAQADPSLIRVVLENLLANAWKFSSKRDGAKIEFGSQKNPDGTLAFFVRDNGAGFDPRNAVKLFAPFQRLHRPEDFPGSGIGLATVQRIIHRHAGRIWAEAQPDKGATFFFTLPAEG